MLVCFTNTNDTDQLVSQHSLFSAIVVNSQIKNGSQITIEKYRIMIINVIYT